MPEMAATVQPEIKVTQSATYLHKLLVYKCTCSSHHMHEDVTISSVPTVAIEKTRCLCVTRPIF